KNRVGVYTIEGYIQLGTFHMAEGLTNRVETTVEIVEHMKGTADIFSPKVVRSATGSLFRVPIVFAENNDELTEFVHNSGKKLVATCLDDSKFYYDEDLRENIALIVGNEGNGISPDLIDKSDVKIKIPMHGSIESLNASVAAAIIMYESVRKRG
ncbi:MAG: RNA methyltransferase, partial [Firmicutes bacterium]|nr:RNA methyltransferase [Bacillota bacterium]